MPNWNVSLPRRLEGKARERALKRLAGHLGLKAGEMPLRLKEGPTFALLLVEHRDVFEAKVGKPVDQWTVTHIKKYFDALCVMSFKDYKPEAYGKCVSLLRNWHRETNDYGVIIKLLEFAVLNWSLVKQEQSWIKTDYPTFGLMFSIRDKLGWAVSNSTSSSSRAVRGSDREPKTGWSV